MVKTKFFIIAIIISVCFSCRNKSEYFDRTSTSEKAESRVAPQEPAAWDYPIKPGTEKWKACSSPEEIYEALQMPEEVLKTINTESLVQICLNYPAPTVFYIFNTPQQGFDGFYKQFNGIRELMSREDAGAFLLKKYASMSLDEFDPSRSLEDQGEYVLKFYYMELFLLQSVVLQSFGEDECKMLLRESLGKLELKSSRGDLFGGPNFGATLWLMAKALNTKGVRFSEEMEFSLNSGHLTDFDIEFVLQQADKYVL